MLTASVDRDAPVVAHRATNLSIYRHNPPLKGCLISVYPILKLSMRSITELKKDDDC